MFPKVVNVCPDFVDAFRKTSYKIILSFSISHQVGFQNFAFLQLWMSVNSIFSRRFMKENCIRDFFNPRVLTKIVLKSYTKLQGVKLDHLAVGTEP